MGNENGEDTSRLRIALEATDTGVWEWDLRTDEVVWDVRMERLFGYDPGEFPGTYRGFASRVHPDDLPNVAAAHERGMEHGFYEATFRVVADGNLLRWVKARAEVAADNGEPIKMIGVLPILLAKSRPKSSSERKTSVSTSSHVSSPTTFEIH